MTLFKKTLLSIPVMSLFLNIQLTHAQEALPAFDTKTNTFNIYEYDIRPWSFHDENGKAIGPVPEIQRWIIEHAGYTYNSVGIVPFARKLRYMETGNEYFACIWVRKEMEAYIIKGPIAGYVTTVAVGLKGNDFNRWEDLHGKKIAVIRGSGGSEKLLNDPLVEKYEVRDLSQAIKMLANKRIDGVTESFFNIIFEMNAQGFSKTILGQSIEIQKNPFHMAVSRKANIDEVTKNIHRAAEEMFRLKMGEKIINDFINDFTKE